MNERDYMITEVLKIKRPRRDSIFEVNHYAAMANKI